LLACWKFLVDDDDDDSTSLMARLLRAFQRESAWMQIRRSRGRKLTAHDVNVIQHS